MKFITLNQVTPYTDEFSFTSLVDAKCKDAIIICNPSSALCVSPVFLHSKKTLTDHICYIQEQKINKAVIVAEDISFLRQCPSLECISVIPALTSDNFDYSPLYDMRCIKFLRCETIYGFKENKIAHVDYSRICGLQHLSVIGAKGHHKIACAEGLKTLCFDAGQPASDTLHGAFAGASLRKLVIGQSPIRTLDGLEQAPHLRKLSLSYNRRLEDIGALSKIKDSLRWLDIEACSKIQDFSVLAELHNLEFLRLLGTNTVSDLSFLENMPRLKFFVVTMNVADGNMYMCEKIPYVSIKNRKHYTHKDKSFSKILLAPNPASWFEDDLWTEL